MNLQKQKRIRLPKGSKAVKKLNDEIHSRDNDESIFCHCYVDRGVKWHHWPYGNEKEDVIHKGVNSCDACHTWAHKDDVQGANRRCCDHLSALYPEHAEYYERHVRD